MARRTRRRRRRSHTSKWKKVTIPLGILLGAGIIAGGVAGSWAVDVYESAPPLSSLKPVQKGRSSAIYAADGSLIGFIQAENIRQPVPERAMPQTLRDATVAIEDKNYFNHGALDPTGIARAAWKDLLAGGKPVQGASTITQQLVRNLYIQNPQETIKRKLIEAHLAYEEEEAHSKDWILTAYLNTAPYGTVEGETAVGVEAAAQTYFGKPAKDLELTESALIAGLPQAPSEYNPFLDPHAALQRRNEVLAAMHEQDYIDGAEYREALHSGLGLSPGHKYRMIRDPFLFDLVQQELIDKYGINTVRNGWPQGLHDDRPRTAGTGAGSGRLLQRLLPRRRPRCRARLDRPIQRGDRRPRLDRRLRKRKRIQLRLAGASPARLLVQDLRADDGDQAGHRSRHHLLRRHFADDARPARRRHLDRQQRRARRRHDVARLRHLGVGQRHLRPARPRRRARKRDRDRARNGHRSPLESVPAEAIGGLAMASRRWNRPTATRPSPAAASTTTRPRSAGLSSPAARSRKPTPTQATGC